MDARDIVRVLARHVYPCQKYLISAGCLFAGGECDFLAVTGAGYLHVVEIKVTVPDFRREFTAPTKCQKHRRLLDGVYPTKHFWFAVPVSLVEAVRPLLPAHCGLIVVRRHENEYRSWHVATVVQQAPKLGGCRPLTPSERQQIIESNSWRYMRRLADYPPVSGTVLFEEVA